MRQLINLIWIISLLQEISCNPDFKEQQKSIFQQSKNIISYLPIKSGSRWESLNSAISFGSIFGQQNSTTIMPDTSMHASLEKSTPSNDEAVLTSESEQSYKSCMMRCQALSSTNNETLDEFTCGCDQLLKPNKIPYKYRDQYITVKQNPFHAVKPGCQNCSKPEKQVKENEPVKQTPNTPIDGSIRIKNNGSKQIFESQPKPQKIYKEVPSEQQNSTSFQKQIKIKKNSQFKINKVIKQKQDLVKNDTIVIKKKSKNEPQQKINKIKENEQVRVKNSGIVKKQQNISQPKQIENIKKQNVNQTNEGIRIKSEQKKVKKEELKQEEVKKEELKKVEVQSSKKQIINPVKITKIKTEESKNDGSIRIKNNDQASIHNHSKIPLEPVIKKASEQSLNITNIKVNKVFKKENKKILKGIPIKENVKYSYVNKTKPILKKKKKILKKNKTKKIIKSKVFGRKNETIPVKDNNTKKAKKVTKKLKRKIKVMKQQKIPIKSKPVEKVSSVIKPVEPKIEIETRIRIKREGKQLVIPKPIVEEKQTIQNIKNPEKEVDNQIKETSKPQGTFKETIKIKQEISQPIEIKKKQKKVVEENDQKPEPKQIKELEKYEIRIKNNGSKILNTLKLKMILKSKNTFKVNLTKEQIKIPAETKTEEVQPVKEIKEIKQQDQIIPQQIENKCKDLPQEDHQIRIKNNGSRKTNKNILKKKSKINKSKIVIHNIPKVVNQPIINDQVPIKVKVEKPLNKTVQVKQEIQKQPAIVNYSNNSIRIKSNGSKQILTNQSKTSKSKKIVSAKVIKQKANISIESIQSSTPKISEDSSKIRVNKKEKIIQDSDENLQKKPNAEIKEDNSIRVKNNGSVSTVVKKQKKQTQINKKKQSSNVIVNKVIKTSISKQNISKKNILKKNISKKTISKKNIPKKNVTKKNISKINISKPSIFKKNITVYKVKVDVPPVAKVSKKEQVIEMKPLIENEKSDESQEEKKKQLEREKQYAKEIFEKPQKQEVKTIKPDELSVRIKNNGTITLKKEQKIIYPKSLNNSVPCNKTKNEAVPVIKDTQNHRNKINYSKPIEVYKKSSKIYKPFTKSEQPPSNVTVTKESIRVKQSDPVSPQLNASKIPKILNVSAPVKKSNKTEKVKVSSSNVSVIKKAKKSKIAKKQLKKIVNATQTKKIKKTLNKKILKNKNKTKKSKITKNKSLKNKTSKKKIVKKAGQKVKVIKKQNLTKPKKAVKKVNPPKIVVKSYPITNVPVHSRDVQKGASIPMKKRKSQKKIVKNISKAASKNVTKVNKTVKENATHKKSKKKLIPVMTKKVKVVNQSKLKVVKKMKKDKSIEDKPLKSVVDEVITKPLKKQKKKSLKNITKSIKKIKVKSIKKNKSKSAKKNKKNVTQAVKKLKVKKVKGNKSKVAKKIKAVKKNKTKSSKKLKIKSVKKNKTKSVKSNKTKSVKKIKVKTLRNKTKKSKIIKKKLALQNKTKIQKPKSKISNKNKTNLLNKTKILKANLTKKANKANITIKKSTTILKNASVPKSQVKKVKIVLQNNKTLKVKAANISKPKQTLKNKSLPVNNITIKKQILNITKKVPIVVKQSIQKSANKSVTIKPTITTKEKEDDDKENEIKDEEMDKDEDDKEVCKQPEVKKTQDEILREIRVKNSGVIQNSKSASHDNYKANVNYQTKNRTTTINFSDDDGSATISITNINGKQLLNVTGDKIACQTKFCKKYSSISQIFTNQRNMTLMTPIVSDIGSLSQDNSNSSMYKSEKEFQAQFINKKLNENSDYNEVLRGQEKLKHLSFRIQKLTLLGNLMKKFFNKNDFKKEWFVRPVIFHFLEFKFIKDKPKVSIIRSIRARNLLGVIKSFKITIKDKFLKNNNTHYGIVGNSKLLFSTSSFKNFLDPKNSELLKKMNYTSNQNEFVNDNISKIFIGYGFFKQIIKLPANLRAQKYPILLSVDKNSFAQDISLQSQLSLNQNILQLKNKNRFLFDEKGNLVKSSEKNFKAFITLVNSFQKKGLFKGVTLDQNQLGVKLRKGLPPKGFQRQFAYAFSPRSMRQVKEGQNNTKKIVNVKENQCKKYLEGSKRYQVCILNDQYRGPKQVISLSRKYNFGAIVYDPERKKISKAADILSSSMRRGLKTIQWNLIQKYIKNRKEYQFMTFSENGPLVCSKNRSDNLCKLMTGYSLTQGWWKNPKFIDSQKLDQFYVIVKNLKTNNIEFINTGCDQEYAVNLMKKMTLAEKNSIGAVLNSDSQLVEMTLTNPNNAKDMQYQSIYEIIGEYLSNNLHLFDKNLRNEYEAGIQ